MFNFCSFGNIDCIFDRELLTVAVIEREESERGSSIEQFLMFQAKSIENFKFLQLPLVIYSSNIFFPSSFFSASDQICNLQMYRICFSLNPFILFLVFGTNLQFFIFSFYFLGYKCFCYHLWLQLPYWWLLWSKTTIGNLDQ